MFFAWIISTTSYFWYGGLKKGRSKMNPNPVIWRSTYEKTKRRWKNWFVLTQLFYLILIASLGWALIHDTKIGKAFTHQRQELEELKTKEIIYSILRSKGISLSQGLDIAEVTIQQSKKLNIPVSLILAVMKKESTFTPFALSSQKAMGLMQIHPATWEWFVKRLDLKLSVHAAFDPATNIIMATHILKDLFVYYKKTSKSESETWESALSAYYAGQNSLSQTGITKSHIQYVAEVNKFKKEFDEKFKN
jgi:soluble lytic murein transglycosylase-like protein